MAGKAGMRKAAPLAAVQARARIWNAARRLRRFTVADIQATAETPVGHTRCYVRKLAAAGYARCASPRRSGYTGGHAVYVLTRDTGPHAPRFGRLGVLDPNLTPAKPLPGEEPVMVPRRDYDRALACVRACAGMSDPEQQVAALRQHISPLPRSLSRAQSRGEGIKGRGAPAQPAWRGA